MWLIQGGGGSTDSTWCSARQADRDEDKAEMEGFPVARERRRRSGGPCPEPPQPAPPVTTGAPVCYHFRCLCCKWGRGHQPFLVFTVYVLMVCVHQHPPVMYLGYPLSPLWGSPAPISVGGFQCIPLKTIVVLRCYFEICTLRVKSLYKKFYPLGVTWDPFPLPANLSLW